MEHAFYRVKAEKIREGDTNTQLAIGKRARCLFQPQGPSWALRMEIPQAG